MYFIAKMLLKFKTNRISYDSISYQYYNFKLNVYVCLL